MEITKILQDIKKSLDTIKINSKVSSYEFKGTNNKESYGSPGGKWDPNEYPAHEFHLNKERWLIRIIPKFSKIVIEAAHLNNLLINYKISEKNFIESNNQIRLIENYTMTVNHRIKVSEAERAMKQAGMKSNLIFEINKNRLDTADIVQSLLTWAEYRLKAKSFIRSNNNDNKSTITSKNTEGQNASTSLNTILYGPPGTGKTYNTINKAVEIIDSTRNDNKINSDDERQKIVARYKKFAGSKNLTFNESAINSNQIEFVTFHQNYTYEDFVIGLKPDIENKANQLTFKQNYGIFYRMCKTAHNDPDNNYVLIIDEINRANISRVFGELITLLEDDKRIGAENELIVTLPNGESFGVPSNLYLIGTMNTADKSIALIDIALRRRFEFEGKFPDLTLIKDTISQAFLKKINENIIKAGKTSDFTIGHAFFMKGLEITKVIESKIIPLLMEYFNNNTLKVEEILKDTKYPYTYNKDNYKWEVKKAPTSDEEKKEAAGEN